MKKPGSQVHQLFSFRHQYGKKISSRKLKLLNALYPGTGNRLSAGLSGKKAIQLYYNTLLFLIAYPDNKAVYKLASRSLEQLLVHIQTHEKIKNQLFNSGLTHTQLCAGFSFEIVKWVRKNQPGDIRLNSFEAGDETIQSILSVVMPKVESEILQDANSNWRTWLKQSLQKDEETLDQLIAIFDGSGIRPEVKDELWNALGLIVEIDFSSLDCLPGSLFTPYYHRSLRKKAVQEKQPIPKPIRVKLDHAEAEHIIQCGRMILIRHFREIDPITFTAAQLVSYYQLPRGLSVALMGMVPERRHPIDSYMGYVVFKNGLPLAYAGSWILFDSARIGLNIFPAYRGGESQYIFEQVLQLHRRVYHLNRFSVDPYQIGKENKDGIHSGAFWVYHHAGFRPIKAEERKLAEAEARKKRSVKSYRSHASTLKKLADSRMELVLHKKAVRFDATDLSLAHAGILEKKYHNNRKLAEESSFKKLTRWLQLKNYQEEKLQFILKNWSVLLMNKEYEFPDKGKLKTTLKKLFKLKASGSEEKYITELQKSAVLRKVLERLI